MADKPAQSIIDACKVAYQLVTPFSSLPIYKLGELLLDSRFDSPIVLPIIAILCRLFTRVQEDTFED